MAILTLSGRTAIAQAIASQPIHLAWGAGDDSWGSVPPQESIEATALANEVGRRIATSVQYAVPDEDGDVYVPVFNDASGNTVSRRFRVTDHPTNNLYLRFNFDFSDASSSVIRELAVFIGTVTDPSLPAGQKYFTPDQIVDPGIMLAVEHLTESIQRSPNSRQSFEFVLTI